jgi:uncharacterized protein YyaL (SSP411 family)
MKERAEQLATATVSLYDEDFFLWSQCMAKSLRAGQVEAADLFHLAEEIEDLGKRDLKEINSRMQVLIAHLLKWRLQPERRSASWESTIVTQRLEIEALLRHSPSLRRTLALELADNYARAIRRAIPETRLPKNQFPSECPFTLAQILDQDYLP